MYMKLPIEILQYQLLVWMRNSCTENHFVLYSLTNKNKISTNKKTS